MEAVKGFVSSLGETIGSYVPSVLGAVLILFLGLILARGIRGALAALLGKIKLNERMQGKSPLPVKMEEVLSSLVYYVLVLYVLMLTLDVLGIEGVLDPVKVMFTDFVGIVPNIIAAGLIGFVGFVIAKMVSEPLAALSTRIDQYAGKLGLANAFSLSKLLGQIVFVLIFVPVLIAALSALKIDAVSVPAIGMLTAMMDAIPNIIGAAIILAVAYVVGKFVTGFLADLLKNLGADELPTKVGAPELLGKTRTFSRLVTNVLFFFIMLTATMSAIDRLNMPQASLVLSQFLVFAGQIVMGLIILGVGTMLANLAYAALSRGPEKSTTAAIARGAILGLVLAMGLRAMGIADDIVNLAFALTFGAVAVTVALAFGLGGREAAGKQMEYWLSKMRGER